MRGMMRGASSGDRIEIPRVGAFCRAVRDDVLRDASKKFPAIITLDGYRYFGIAQAIADMLTGQGNTEGVFIVSIGAPSEFG